MGILENSEGETYAYSVLGGVFSTAFSLMPKKVEYLVVAASAFTDFATGVGTQGSNEEITDREWYEIGGAVVVGAAVFFAPVVGTGAVAIGVGVCLVIAAGYIGEWIGGQVYDYQHDQDSKPINPSDHSIAEGLEKIHNYHIEMLFSGSGVTRVGGGSGNDNIPNPNTPRPSDEAIQTSRDIVAGRLFDTFTGEIVYADAIIRGVAAAEKKREREIAEAAALQREHNRDRTDGGSS